MQPVGLDQAGDQLWAGDRPAFLLSPPPRFSSSPPREVCRAAGRDPSAEKLFLFGSPFGLFSTSAIALCSE